MKKLLLLAILPLMLSCNGQEKNANENTTTKTEKQNSATVEFIGYWDKNNNSNFVTLKEGKEFSLEFPDDIRGNYNRGDELEIKWTNNPKYDLPLLVSVKRTKEGKLTAFLKEHPLKLQYTWNYECDGRFISKSYSIVQYYFSVTQNEKAKQALADLSKNDKEKEVKIGNKVIDYIIEKETTVDGKKLILLNIGIFTYGGDRVKIQDIYYESETNRLFELNQNKLAEINGRIK